jgi:hypothetical protein
VGGVVTKSNNTLSTTKTVRMYSTISSSSLDNSFLVGFCDGEATFSVGVLKHKKLKIG